MPRKRDDGELMKCPHCEGLGTQDGPGGKEPCCHCDGEGERWVDEEEIEDAH